MNITLRVNFSSWTATLFDLVANPLASLCVATFAFALSGIAVAQQVPQKAPQSPGTAVVAPGVHASHLGVDEIPPGTYDINTKETLVRYGVDHMGFSEFWGTFQGATGTIAFDPKDVGATKLEVKVPIA